MPLIQKILDCSTSHLSPEATKYLDTVELHQDRNSDHQWFDGAGCRPWVMPYQYGWVVWCDEDLDPDAPAELALVLRLAREEHGCDFVKFDADGDVLEGFPTWKW